MTADEVGSASTSRSWVRTSSNPIRPVSRRRADRLAREASTSSWRRICSGFAPGHPGAGSSTRSGPPTYASVAPTSCDSRGSSPWGTPPVAAVARASAQACRTRRATSAVSRASGSIAGVMPSVFRTWAAKLWIVEIAAASNSATARSSRARQAGTSPVARNGESLSSSATTPSASAVADAHQLTPDARPELGGRRPRERDHQQFRRGDLPLGEEPRRQGRQGVGLAGPGAGLDDDLPLRQRTEDVEVGGHGRSAAVASTVPHKHSA